LASPRCFCDEIVGRGLGHGWIIGYRSPNGLPKVTEQNDNGQPSRLNTPSTRGLVSSTRPTELSLRCLATAGIRRVLADCWQTRLVVWLAVDTQILSPAAQDPQSGRRPVSVVGPDHGFHLIGRVATFEMPLILGRRVAKQPWQRVFRRILRNLPLQTRGRDHATLKSLLVSVEHTRELDAHDEEPADYGGTHR
jgi:hypothetical protein